MLPLPLFPPTFIHFDVIWASKKELVFCFLSPFHISASLPLIRKGDGGFWDGAKKKPNTFQQSIFFEGSKIPSDVLAKIIMRFYFGKEFFCVSQKENINRDTCILQSWAFSIIIYILQVCLILLMVWASGISCWGSWQSSMMPRPDAGPAGNVFARKE